MKKYNIMFIIRPTVTEEEKEQTINNFKEIITSNKGNIIETKDMGQRELAYEIKDYKSGYYYMWNIEVSDDKAIKEFDRLSLISDDIIRHLITTN